MKRLYLYTLTERIWHWSQAIGIILLLLSGFQIRYPAQFPLFGEMGNAVRMHLFIAFCLLANAFLGLFYQLSTVKIRRYIPMPVDFMRGSFLQARHYLYGLFRGEPHPFEKSEEQRLNPLQKLTYFGLLNGLLPLQIVTGFILWSAEYRPGFVASLGGLKLLGAIHALGGFFFLSFLIMHIYLTTTGHTVFSTMKAMITGYEEFEEADPGVQAEEPV